MELAQLGLSPLAIPTLTDRFRTISAPSPQLEGEGRRRETAVGDRSARLRDRSACWSSTIVEPASRIEIVN
jgi:hypothetical protein